MGAHLLSKPRFMKCTDATDAPLNRCLCERRVVSCSRCGLLKTNPASHFFMPGVAPPITKVCNSHDINCVVTGTLQCPITTPAQHQLTTHLVSSSQQISSYFSVPFASTVHICTFIQSLRRQILSRLYKQTKL